MIGILLTFYGPDVEEVKFISLLSLVDTKLDVHFHATLIQTFRSIAYLGWDLPVGVQYRAILGAGAGDASQLAAAQALLHAEIAGLGLITKPGGKEGGGVRPLENGVVDGRSIWRM